MTVDNSDVDVPASRERGRVASELVDSIIQTIFAVGLSLDSCRLTLRERPDDVEARLAEATVDLNQALTSIRVSALDLAQGAGEQVVVRQSSRSDVSRGSTE